MKTPLLAVLGLWCAVSVVAATDPVWQNLSSKQGDLPAPPGGSTQQTGAVVADFDGDGVNDFILSFRQKPPALVWYRRTATGWDLFVIEKDYLTIEAGGAVRDIDGDGDLDLLNKPYTWDTPRVDVWLNHGTRAAANAPSPAPGPARDAGGGPLGERITIPAGRFLMGNGGQEGAGEPEEFPQHSVHLSAYQIGKHEVTRGQYRRFIEAGGYEDPRFWSPEGWKWKEANALVYAGLRGQSNVVARPGPREKRRAPERWAPEQEWIGHGHGHPRFTQTDQHPVVGVTYYEAEAYCQWAGGRLPTEAEWEKAARWDEKKQQAYVWPWGNVWDPEKCNNPDDHNPVAGGGRVNQSAPVGSYPAGASPYGCLDMVGNAWEWVASPSQSHPGNPTPYDHGAGYRLVKGGCWDDAPTSSARCSYRTWYLPLSSSGTGPGDCDYIGFRVAR